MRYDNIAYKYTKAHQHTPLHKAIRYELHKIQIHMYSCICLMIVGYTRTTSFFIRLEEMIVSRETTRAETKISLKCDLDNCNSCFGLCSLLDLFYINKLRMFLQLRKSLQGLKHPNVLWETMINLFRSFLYPLTIEMCSKSVTKFALICVTRRRRQVYI